MGEFLDFFKQKKNLANLLILGILILALPLAVRVAREQQIIKSRATADPIVFTGDNVSQKDGKWIAKKPQVSLELTSTLGSLPSPTPAVCSGNACTDCILNNRGDVLDYYKKNGWDISCAGWGKIVADWCKIDPASCQSLKAGSCSAVCSITTFVLPPTKSASFSLVKTAYAADACSMGPPQDTEVCHESSWVCPNGIVCAEGHKYCVYNQNGNTWSDCRMETANNCDKCATFTPCEFKGDPKDKYNQCCGDGLSQKITRKRDASGAECGYDKGACNQKDPACGSGGGTDKCPAGQDQVAKDKIGQSVDNTVVGADGNKYTGSGQCGYLYYVWKSTLSNGNVCAARGFGAWTPQDDCKKVTTTCGATNQTPLVSAECATCIAGQRSGLIDSIKKANPSLYTTCADNQLISFWCNGGVSADATAQCNTTKASAACASKCSGTSATTVSFRIAENAADLVKAEWKDYNDTTRKLNWDFKTSGQKTIFVEFKDSNGKTGGCGGGQKDQPCNAQIKVADSDPVIKSCSLSFENSVTALNLTGENFGSETGTLKSGEVALTQIKEWKENKIKVLWPGAPTGEVLPVILTTKSGQISPEGQCSSISLLALGAKVFCRAPSSHDTDDVELTLAGAFAGGTKVKQKVKIDKVGNITGLNQKLENGKNYKLSLKAPLSLRKTVQFTPTDGAINIPNFVLPVGDISPADGGDGMINSLDKAELNSQWIIAKPGSGRSGDFNKDGRVNSIDWSCMRFDFGDSNDPEPETGGSIGVGTTGQ